MKEKINRRELMKSAGVLGASAVGSQGLIDTVKAQSSGPNNEISGVVEDSSGVLQNATVLAVPHDTSKAVLETSTDANGEYIFTESDLYTSDSLYLVVAYAGSESTPLRSEQNYPFMLANGSVAIPDSELDYLWHAPAVSSIAPWTDSIASVDTAQIGDPQLSNDINTNQTVSYDGVDDVHEASQSLGTGTNEEYCLVTVVKPDSPSSTNCIFCNGQGPSTDGVRLVVDNGSGGLRVIHNGVVAVDSDQSLSADEPYIVVSTYDGASIICDLNGTEIINTSDSAPTTPTSVASIGALPNSNGSWYDGSVGAAGWESTFADATRRDDLTNDFADAFGITI